MALPCAVLCLLALSMDFKPSPDIQKCSYCAQMRALSVHCEQKPLICSEWDPDSLIYCLSRDERPWGRDALKRSTRCISHANLLLMNQSSIQIGQDALRHSLSLLPIGNHQKHCTFEAGQQCDCPDCPLHQGRIGQEAKESVDLGTELENVALLLDKLIIEEEGEQNPSVDWKFEETVPIRKTTRRTLPPKLMAAASKPLRRPLPKSPEGGDNGNFRLIPFPVDFLHSSSASTKMYNFLNIILIYWPIHFLLHSMVTQLSLPHFLF